MNRLPGCPGAAMADPLLTSEDSPQPPSCRPRLHKHATTQGLGPEDDLQAHMVARALALAHYQLKGPLRMNFVRNYLNSDIMGYDEIQAFGAYPSTVVLSSMLCIGASMPWVYAVATKERECPMSSVMQYTMDPLEAGKCVVASLWMLLFTPVACLAVVLLNWCVDHAFPVRGRQTMIRYYHILDVMLPFLESLKYYRTPFLYTLVSQGYTLLVAEMVLMTILLQDVSAAVTGYAVGNVLVRMAPVVLAPPSRAIGTLQSELLQWSSDPAVQSLFSRLLTHDQPAFAVTDAEFKELCKAGRSGGRLERLFSDAFRERLVFGLDNGAVERPVFFSELYLKTVHIPLHHTDGQGQRRYSLTSSVGSEGPKDV
mmetsp:Transcript_71943/g.222259  ORF Transcript_71943/g.222259 Transcript_71943/m.222259 type:complete len:370 (+) Transcript_71943:2-1111(+)